MTTVSVNNIHILTNFLECLEVKREGFLYDLYMIICINFHITAISMLKYSDFFIIPCPGKTF